MSRFKFAYVDESDREKLLLEVEFDGQRIFQLYEEDDNYELRMKLLTDLYILKSDVKFDMSFSEFEDGLVQAKRIYLKKGDGVGIIRSNHPPR